jgi:hypothetical protein
MDYLEKIKEKPLPSALVKLYEVYGDSRQWKNIRASKEK